MRITFLWFDKKLNAFTKPVTPTKSDHTRKSMAVNQLAKKILYTNDSNLYCVLDAFQTFIAAFW